MHCHIQSNKRAWNNDFIQRQRLKQLMFRIKTILRDLQSEDAARFSSPFLQGETSTATDLLHCVLWLALLLCCKTSGANTLLRGLQTKRKKKKGQLCFARFFSRSLRK